MFLSHCYPQATQLLSAEVTNINLVYFKLLQPNLKMTTGRKSHLLLEESVLFSSVSFSNTSDF